MVYAYDWKRRRYNTTPENSIFINNITTMKLSKINKLPKEWNRKQAENLKVLIIINDDIYELVEKKHRKDKLDTNFGIEDDGEHTNSD